MTWLRHNFMAIVVLVAIALSFVVANNESHARDRAQHGQIVASCVRGSQRTALNAAFAMDASVTRAKSGKTKTDKQGAYRYGADAAGQIALIPAPQGLEGSPEMAEIEVKLIGGRPTAVVTKRALALQKAGCERANP